MKNYAPLIVLLLVILVALAIYGPGVYRGMQFKRALGSMLESAKKGDTSQIAAFIMPSQRANAQHLFETSLPVDYQHYIESLRLTSWRFTGKHTVNALVTCKVNTGDFAGIYQGMLIWRNNGKWEWDFLASKGAEFSTSGEPHWIDLGSLLEMEH